MKTSIRIYIKHNLWNNKLEIKNGTEDMKSKSTSDIDDYIKNTNH
jgi:hypothetical protein